MRMSPRAVEYMVRQLGEQELSVRANAPDGPIFLCSCGCNEFLPFSQINPAFHEAVPTALCYNCRHEWRAHDKTVVNLQEGGVFLIQVYFDPYKRTPNLTALPTVAQDATRPSQIPS